MGEKGHAPYKIRVYPGADAAFTIYEDDGETYDYENGDFVEIPLAWNDDKQELTIGKRKGKMSGIVKGREYKIVLVSSENGTGIELAQMIDKNVIYKGKAFKIEFATLDVNN